MLFKNRSIQLTASTLVELLIVMIISGILFLLLFDSLDIVRRFGNKLTDKLHQQSNALYSHQIMEGLFERSDSIQRQDNELRFYRYGTIKAFLAVDSLHLLVRESERTDTLFDNLYTLKSHFIEEKSLLIDSLYVAITVGRDTIQLHYGLPVCSATLTEKTFEDDPI